MERCLHSCLLTSGLSTSGFAFAHCCSVEAIDYVAPLWTRAAAVAICLLGGAATSVLLEASLGDATWAVSSGIGALFAAAVFEVGRPKRLTVDEAQQLEAQWQDFGELSMISK